MKEIIVKNEAEFKDAFIDIFFKLGRMYQVEKKTIGEINVDIRDNIIRNAETPDIILKNIQIEIINDEEELGLFDVTKIEVKARKVNVKNLDKCLVIDEIVTTEYEIRTRLNIQSEPNHSSIKIQTGLFETEYYDYEVANDGTFKITKRNYENIAKSFRIR